MTSSQPLLAACMNTQFTGDLKPGTVFRLAGYDIRCRITMVNGQWVEVDSLSSEGLVGESTQYRMDKFRATWQPERRHSERWAEATV